MLCSSWTNPQMTASLHWELRLLHNFNPSKNRLTLMVGELTCKTEDWTKQRRPRSQPSPQFKPPPPLYLESAPHLLKILKMDFFAHSLLISSLSWHLDFLTTPHMGTILSDLQDRSFTLPHFNCDLPFITQRPAENGRFSKNGIEFPSLKQFGICWRNIFGISLVREDDRLTMGLLQTRLINTVNTFCQIFNLVALQCVRLQGPKDWKRLKERK